MMNITSLLVIFLLLLLSCLAFVLWHIWEKNNKAWQNKLTTKAQELDDAIVLLEAARWSDPVTQLHNRNHFLNHIAAVVKEAEALNALDPLKEKTLMFMRIDIDGFEQCNQQHGFIIGDSVLKQLASLLKQSLSKDDLLFRWGNDDILVICKAVNPENMPFIAERIKKAIESHEFIISPEISLSFTASMGLSPHNFKIKSNHNLVYEIIIALADAALYSAKTVQGNTWVIFSFADTMTQIDSELLKDIYSKNSKGLVQHNDIKISSADTRFNSNN